MSSTKVDLPLPETPVTHVRQPRGNETSIFFRLFSLAPTTVSQPSGRGWSALFWNRNARSSGKIIASQRIFRARDVVESSLCHNLAATRPCARTKIKNVVGSPNRFFIVLDYDDGVPKIAQFSKRSQ